LATSRAASLSLSPKGLKDERQYPRGNGNSLVADLDDNLRFGGVRLDDHDLSCEARLLTEGLKRFGIVSAVSLLML
jgi:hypothetical protein